MLLDQLDVRRRKETGLASSVGALPPSCNVSGMASEAHAPSSTCSIAVMSSFSSNEILLGHSADDGRTHSLASSLV